MASCSSTGICDAGAASHGKQRVLSLLDSLTAIETAAVGKAREGALLPRLATLETAILGHETTGDGIRSRLAVIEAAVRRRRHHVMQEDMSAGLPSDVDAVLELSHEDDVRVPTVEAFVGPRGLEQLQAQLTVIISHRVVGNNEGYMPNRGYFALPTLSPRMRASSTCESAVDDKGDTVQEVIWPTSYAASDAKAETGNGKAIPQAVWAGA